jgi:hypothetical protein
VQTKGKEKARRGALAWLLVAPQGFEPRYAAPEAAVLPLNEGATAPMFAEIDLDVRHFSASISGPAAGYAIPALEGIENRPPPAA